MISTRITDDKLRFLARGIGMSVVQPVLDRANDEIVVRAKRRVRVRTGFTRSTIERRGNSVVAGGAALYLEFGTRFQSAHPFLLPSFNEVMRELPDKVAGAISEALR